MQRIKDAGRRLAVMGAAVFVAGAAFAAGGESEPAFDPSSVSIDDLAWMEGVWSGPNLGGTFEARYSGSAGGSLLGVSKLVGDDGGLRSWELERFHLLDGVPTMEPYPDGEKSPAAFPLVAFDAAARRAEFANPDHDFPQRLIYHRVDDVTMHITAAALGPDGKPRGFRLKLKRRE